jgi:hypothetical protein
MRRVLEKTSAALVSGATMLYFGAGIIAMCVPAVRTMFIG